MFFSFVGGGSVCPGDALDYVPGGLIGELHMVFHAHLFFCSFKQTTLELAGREKWPAFFSAA
jgi:hypothetical protein